MLAKLATVAVAAACEDSCSCPSTLRLASPRPGAYDEAAPREEATARANTISERWRHTVDVIPSEALWGGEGLGNMDRDTLSDELRRIASEIDALRASLEDYAGAESDARALSEDLWAATVALERARERLVR